MCLGDLHFVHSLFHVTWRTADNVCVLGRRLRSLGLREGAGHVRAFGVEDGFREGAEERGIL